MANAAENIAEAGGLSGHYTQMPAAEARGVLGDLYGLDGGLKRFDTEKDDTFRVTTEDGARYILKIANPEESAEELDFLNGIMAQVGRADPGIPIPRVIPAESGEMRPLIGDASGQNRFVRLLTYLDGTPLSDTTSTPEGREKIGTLLARLRLATAGFRHPGEHRKLAWDVQHLTSLDTLLSHVHDADRRLALNAGLERFIEVEPQLRRCRRQVLHNDFSQSNILVDHDNPDFVTGIIDFGDAVNTAVAIDVSTALLNQLPRTPADDLFAAGRDVVRGYVSVADLQEGELRLIPHLVMARVVARALLTIWRAELFPENETYILRNTEQGWHQLDWFLSRSVDQVSDQLNGFL